MASLLNPASILEADARTRTGDPFITSEVLYQLSYVGTAWKASFEYSPVSLESQIVRLLPGLVPARGSRWVEHGSATTQESES